MHLRLRNGTVLASMAWCAVAAGPASADRSAARPMNVVFILCDDLNVRLGCYGYEDVRSANLDRLAAQGMRFDRAYCQYPVCNPSRSSLLTGLRPETTGVLSNLTPLREAQPEIVTLPQCFKQQGYWTATVNKFFHDRDNDGDRSWHEIARHGDARNPVMQKAIKEFEAQHGAIDAPENRQRWAERRRALRDLAAGQTPPGYGPTDMSDEETTDGKGARQIIQWLEAKAYGDKPFFIGWGVARPHIPHWAPQKYFDLYPLDRFRFEPQPVDDWKDIPEIAINKRYQLYGDPFDNDRIRREYTAAYYACITFIDAQVGLLLAALDRLGLTDNTIVVFTGDHGYFLGEHRLWEKGMLFEEVARVPLLVKVPGRTRPGSVCARLVEFVDLFPTLAELCAVKPPDNLEGSSFVPLLAEPERPWKQGAFTIVQHGDVLGRTVRSERYRYTEWGGPEVSELYDLAADPCSYTNLANQPDYARQVEEMQRLLQGGWKGARPDR